MNNLSNILTTTGTAWGSTKLQTQDLLMTFLWVRTDILYLGILLQYRQHDCLFLLFFFHLKLDNLKM